MVLWIKSIKIFFLGCAAALCLLCAALRQNAYGENISEDNLVKIVQKVLQDHPDILLDVLRKNSEAVLDIAQQGSNIRRQRSLEKQWDEDLKTAKKIKLENRPVLGSPKAKVRIVAFSDFSCHFCQQASGTVDSLLQEFGKDVCLVFKNFPLDEKGVGGSAARYFLATAQQSDAKAWELYRKLFAGRDRLVTEGEKYLKNTVADLGLDMKRFNRDLYGKKVSDILKEDMEDAKKLGIEGTPYFLVNDIVVRGALPLDLFRLAVQKALRAS